MNFKIFNFKERWNYYVLVPRFFIVFLIFFTVFCLIVLLHFLKNVFFRDPNKNINETCFINSVMFLFFIYMTREKWFVFILSFHYECER